MPHRPGDAFSAIGETIQGVPGAIKSGVEFQQLIDSIKSGKQTAADTQAGESLIAKLGAGTQTEVSPLPSISEISQPGFTPQEPTFTETKLSEVEVLEEAARRLPEGNTFLGVINKRKSKILKEQGIDIRKEKQDIAKAERLKTLLEFKTLDKRSERQFKQHIEEFKALSKENLVNLNNQSRERLKLLDQELTLTVKNITSLSQSNQDKIKALNIEQRDLEQDRKRHEERFDNVDITEEEWEAGRLWFTNRSIELRTNLRDIISAANAPPAAGGGGGRTITTPVLPAGEPSSAVNRAVLDFLSK